MTNFDKQLSDTNIKTYSAYKQVYEHLNELPRFRTYCNEITHIGCWSGALTSLALSNMLFVKKVNLLDASLQAINYAKDTIEVLSSIKSPIIVEANECMVVSDTDFEPSNRLAYIPNLARITTVYDKFKDPNLNYECIESSNIKTTSQLMISRTTWFKPSTFVIAQIGLISTELVMNMISGKYAPLVIQFQITPRAIFSGILKFFANHGYVVPKTCEFETDDVMVEVILTKLGRGFLIRHKRKSKPTYVESILDDTATVVFSKPII